MQRVAGRSGSEADPDSYWCAALRGKRAGDVGGWPSLALGRDEGEGHSTALLEHHELRCELSHDVGSITSQHRTNRNFIQSHNGRGLLRVYQVRGCDERKYSIDPNAPTWHSWTLTRYTVVISHGSPLFAAVMCTTDGRIQSREQSAESSQGSPPVPSLLSALHSALVSPLAIPFVSSSCCCQIRAPAGVSHSESTAVMRDFSPVAKAGCAAQQATHRGDTHTQLAPRLTRNV